MWWVRIMRPARTAAAVAAVGMGAAALLAPAPAAAAPSQSQPSTAPPNHAVVPSERDDRIVNNVSLRLDDHGVLHGRETLSFGDTPPEGFTRTFATREPYDEDNDRLYRIDGITAETADGTAVELAVDEHRSTTDVRFDPDGTTTVVLRYQVRGVMDEVGQGVELGWTAVGGYSAPVAETNVVVDAPRPPVALSCAAGEQRSSIYCTSSDMGGHQALVARFLQADLAPGERLDIAVGYPAGTAPGDPVLDRSWSLSSAFAITPWTTSIFGVLLVVLVGGLITLIRIRGRDERAVRVHAAAGDHAPLQPGVGEPGGVRFHPPDDVHPGQIGTLIDEQVNVVDLTATVVDLAVRGHLTIRELPHAQFSPVDWRLEQNPAPADDALLPYERKLLDALFHQWHQVKLSELGRSGFADRLTDVRDELYRDMVRLKWFANRPNVERSSWATVGIGLTAAGVVLTVLLAIFTTAAFTGLAVVIAGAAVTVGAQYMPAKTALGSTVYAHTLGFRAYLLGADTGGVPPGQRVRLFSRYLPYAMIFDNVERWAGILASAGTEEMQGDALPWYVGPDDWTLADFADSIKTFTLTLAGVISNARQFRNLV
ncbi:hypothetical protein HNR23_003936 [Nocardiopsis mwathae]|uniref:DUF2207 domain-containing protein n=1 Tax=Nocardiopsis mwathae TaxID=1472723 RepID=A0A7W9YMD4_9ACTN|nr:DUF2207 domain-containing protein [Nocardiopsis mwathae]MBB6173876.1 hypothetical protein [Nocardiopsis mwathae]